LRLTNTDLIQTIGKTMGSGHRRTKTASKNWRSGLGMTISALRFVGTAALFMLEMTH
jgi:hypothetical protein